MNELTYPLTQEDYFAFALESTYAIRNGKQARRTAGLTVGFTTAVVGFLVAIAFGHTTAGLILGAVLAVVAGGFTWLTYPTKVAAQLRKTLEQSGFRIDGHYRVRIDEQGLHEAGPYGAGVHYWHAAGPIRETATHVFVMISGGGGVIIPRTGREQAVAEFVAELRRTMSARGS